MTSICIDFPRGDSEARLRGNDIDVEDDRARAMLKKGVIPMPPAIQICFVFGISKRKRPYEPSTKM